MLRRLVPASVAAALLVTGLSACGSQQVEAEDCTQPYAPGVLSDSVVTFGDIGAKPEVNIPADVSIKTTQRTLVEASQGDTRDGDPAGDGSLVGVNLLAFDSTNGEQLYESLGFEAGTPEYLLISDESPNPLADSVRCAAPGDRVILALSPEESIPFAQQLGMASEGSVVFVIDLVSSTDTASQGRVKGLPSGYPAVVTDDAGIPGVVLPPRSAPTGISSAVRIEGDGASIGAEDRVIAQVLEVDWDGTVATNTWETGPIAIESEELAPQTGASYRPELTGKTVGSQVVVVENQDDVERVVIVDVLAIL